MGFCLFNNVAIGAREALAAQGVARVSVVDWDVHHGNGTQRLFEDDPNLLYFSTHQYPYYPGTGDAGEAGSGRGEGATVNVPLPAGCSDAEYLGVLQRILVPVTLAFRPEFSIGVRGLRRPPRRPPRGDARWEKGFAAMASIVRSLADQVCGGRLAYFLEGGYASSGLREGTGAVLDATLAPEASSLPGPVEAPDGSLLSKLVGLVISVQGRRYPDLGAW